MWTRKQPKDHTPELIELLREQNQNQQKFTEKILETINDQQEVLVKLLSQYISNGANTKSSLNDRLDERENYVRESEWEPIPSPFDGM